MNNEWFRLILLVLNVREGCLTLKNCRSKITVGYYYMFTGINENLLNAAELTGNCLLTRGKFYMVARVGKASLAYYQGDNPKIKPKE